MAKYVDGFVIPIPKKNLAAYRRMANWGRKTWMKHGALQYFECVGDDLNGHPGCDTGFSTGIHLKPGETVMYSFIIFRSKAHRDAVNAKVMRDPSMQDMPKTMPFDMKRFMYGGFKVIVEG